MSTYILAIDQGTTSSRAIIFNEKGLPLWQAQQEFKQYYPDDGWVEHDPEEIWVTTLQVCQQVMQKGKLRSTDIAAIGITNQRETTVVWDRETGKPIYNAIVWQDRRTASYCKKLKQAGKEALINQKTGLLIDPYFSASKLNWLLDNVPDARENAEAGKLLFGTIDTFLLWRLTGGKSHKTDATNASRTQLFNIHTQQWDEELLKLHNVPVTLMPEVMDCSAEFGVTERTLFGGEIPILSMAGDQQAALVGQACFKPGMVKSTYGTGCFVIMNTGEQVIQSENRLLTTIGYRLNGQVNYAIEGSIFIAGAAMQWLRDGLRLIPHANVTEALAQVAKKTHGVYMVPAFTGLGAPYWDPHARGAILGLTRDTGVAEIVAAALQSVCYQTKDLMNAMAADGVEPTTLRVDGGMVVNNWMVQFLADILGVTVERPQVTETTALGVAYLAGLHKGIYPSIEDIAECWHSEQQFEVSMEQVQREKLYRGWQDAVERVKSKE
ncbi:glycerol kinase GlpK [Endozoicomonas sp. SM1973]|uniref:Glycerol kinase n=1 Tax=Spartinivicinus marinus TaxID=2994442 RepID=A0A853ID27_9GAMM|nr:glycerol kinase GlpK [Spartinivicinus marinus]MCX4028648.1 glycerol kinase GlpK [Spartinivicinus marinus]NYZ67085.1 glycerol kinase GlpK [Spartinivicinus marinus]